MTLIVAKGLPAIEELREEGIVFSDGSEENKKQLKILVLNLMPTKEATERQLLRLLGNTNVPIKVDFIHLTSRESKNVRKEHLEENYQTFSRIKDQKYDGLVITGAPVEHLLFNEVAYVEELRTILDWSQKNVSYRFFICWGAQFALNYYYDIEKSRLDKKLFGVFEYQVNRDEHPYLKGFANHYTVPQSRHTRVNYQQLLGIEDIEILSYHPQHGPDMIVTKNRQNLFVFGHLEYEKDTLQKEYQRDLLKGEEITMPENYYRDAVAKTDPILNWRCSSKLLWTNWINEINQQKK